MPARKRHTPALDLTSFARHLKLPQFPGFHALTSDEAEEDLNLILGEEAAAGRAEGGSSDAPPSGGAGGGSGKAADGGEGGENGAPAPAPNGDGEAPIPPPVLSALEDMVFGDALPFAPSELHEPGQRMGSWVASRLVVEDALLQSASNPASIHRGLSVLPATLGAGAGGNPLASGVLKLQLNLRQRLAALHAKQEERDHLFLRRRAQYASELKRYQAELAEQERTIAVLSAATQATKAKLAGRGSGVPAGAGAAAGSGAGGATGSRRAGSAGPSPIAGAGASVSPAQGPPLSAAISQPLSLGHGGLAPLKLEPVPSLSTVDLDDPSGSLGSGSSSALRRSSYFKTTALGTCGPSEMLQLQNLHLRQRLAEALHPAGSVLACGDSVSTPFGDGVVLTQRDGDDVTAVKLQWGAVAFLNSASLVLTARASEIEPFGSAELTAAGRRGGIGSRAPGFPTAAAGTVAGQDLAPRIVFGPLSRWQKMCGRRVGASSLAADSIMLSAHGSSSQEALVAAQRSAQNTQAAVKLVAPAIAAAAKEAPVYRSSWNAGAPRGVELVCDPLRSSSAVGFVAGVMGERQLDQFDRMQSLPLSDGAGLLSVSSPMRTADTPTAHRARDINMAGATPASSLARTDAQMYKAEVQRLKFQLRTSEDTRRDQRRRLTDSRHTASQLLMQLNAVRAELHQTRVELNARSAALDALTVRIHRLKRGKVDSGPVNDLPAPAGEASGAGGAAPALWNPSESAGMNAILDAVAHEDDEEDEDSGDHEDHDSEGEGEGEGEVEGDGEGDHSDDGEDGDEGEVEPEGEGEGAEGDMDDDEGDDGLGEGEGDEGEGDDEDQFDEDANGPRKAAKFSTPADGPSASASAAARGNSRGRAVQRPSQGQAAGRGGAATAQAASEDAQGRGAARGRGSGSGSGAAGGAGSAAEEGADKSAAGLSTRRSARSRR